MDDQENKTHWALPIVLAAGTALCTGLVNWLIEELKERRKKKPEQDKQVK